MAHNNPLASEGATVIEGNARFTVLTDRLVRMEWSADGKKFLGTKSLTQMMEENRNAVNKDLPQYSQISAIELVASEFEKTPKRSIKRYLYK